jgi:GWxTD domain-containing protein
MRKMSVGLAMMMFVAVTAAGQLTAPYAGWGDTAAKWLMTKDEAKQWKAIRNDAEAKKFVDLFWARRDPTPATARNEFKEEFDLRVGLADQSFTTAKTKGSLSDRGRAVILLGSPYTVTSKGGGGRVAGNPMNTAASADGSVSVGGTRGAGPTITWTYASDKKPKFIARKDFELLFSDERGGGEFEFAITPRSNPEVFMGEAVKAYLLHPELKEVPTYADASAGGAVPAAAPARTTEFRNSSLKEAIDALRAEKKMSTGPAHLTWGEFVTPTGEGFVPVSLYVPATAGIPAGTKLTFFGVIENEKGVFEVLEEDATLAASGKDAYFDKSLNLPPGKYKATFGLAANGKAVSVASMAMAITGLNPTEAAISDLILTSNAYPLPSAQEITDPYAFGGLKVVPKGDATFTTAEDFTYFFEVRNPGVDEAGNPKLLVKMDITGKAGEKPVSLNFPMSPVDAQPLKGVKNHYGVIQAFSLADFKPGQYTVKMRVQDAVLKKNYNFEKQFTIKAP